MADADLRVGDLKLAGRMLREFVSNAGDYSLTLMKGGNINDTYLAETSGRHAGKFVLQRINGYVFRDPAAVMRNIGTVTGYIADNFPEESVLRYHTASDGRNYAVADDGSFWRMCGFIEGGSCRSPYDCGRAFAHFQRLLSGLDASLLEETIPAFHDTEKRIAALEESYRKDQCGRAAQAGDVCSYVFSSREKATRISRLSAEGKIPVRTVHNDTKTDNIIMGAGGVTTVIDLDTVMPGIGLFDFADTARSMCNRLGEETGDPEDVRADTAAFREIARGFTEEAVRFYTKPELTLFVPAFYSLAVEQAARFACDYLDGDVYFKTTYPRHNLDRALRQMHLAMDIEKKESELEDVMAQLLAGAVSTD